MLKLVKKQMIRDTVNRERILDNWKKWMQTKNELMSLRKI